MREEDSLWSKCLGEMTPGVGGDVQEETVSSASTEEGRGVNVKAKVFCMKLHGQAMQGEGTTSKTC